MKIRIVIPCYNSENYITTTFNHLRLVLNDCSSFDIDVFFIDDGSQDDTLAKLNGLCNNIDKFYVYSKKNGGEGSARNFGLDINPNDYNYVFFVDSDDYLLEGFKSALVELDKKKPDILVCSYIQTDSISSKILKTYNQLKKKYSRQTALEQFLYRNFVPGIGNTFFKKSKIRYSKFKLGADSLFTFENLLISNAVIGIPINIYDYKIRSGSAMDSQSFDNLKVGLIISKIIKSNYKSLIIPSNFFLFNEMYGYYNRTNNIINSNKKLINPKWFFKISLKKIVKTIIYILIQCWRSIKN